MQEGGDAEAAEEEGENESVVALFDNLNIETAGTEEEAVGQMTSALEMEG